MRTDADDLARVRDPAIELLLTHTSTLTDEWCEHGEAMVVVLFDASRQAPMTAIYRYSFDKRLVVFWGVFGVRPGRDRVTLTDDGRLRATFGLFKLVTPLDNVDGAHITRNYRWWTAAGARGSMKDDGLTFGTNANAGVCIHFREKVPSALTRKGHSALTVTVEDVEGLTEALTRR